MDRLLTPDDMCQLLGISRRTLLRWISSGRVPAPIRVGSEGRPLLRWPAEVIQQWLAAGCPPVAAEQGSNA